MFEHSFYLLMQAPLAVFCYTRIEHLKRTLDSLLINQGVSQFELHLFSDGAADAEDESKITTLRAYLKTIVGFKNVFIHEAPVNKGLSKSIIEGVGWLCEQYGRVIVLEDDMVTTPYFLQYMNEALDLYANVSEVICIHGYNYPVEGVDKPHFLKGADCWGWATWADRWQLFEQDAQLLKEKLQKANLLSRLDFDGAFPYTKMLNKQIQGKNDSWAIRWYAAALLADKYTLYPGRSLLTNIGMDNSGTHSMTTNLYQPRLAEGKPTLPHVVEEQEVIYQAYRNYFKKLHRSQTIQAIFQKLRRWLRRG